MSHGVNMPKFAVCHCSVNSEMLIAFQCHSHRCGTIPDLKSNQMLCFIPLQSLISHCTHSPQVVKLVCAAMQKQSKGSLFQRGVTKLDLSSAFRQLQHKLGNSASGLENVEAMAIDSAVED